MNSSDQKVPGRWLYAAGGILTSLYLAVLAIYCFDRWADIRAMPPNNIGDFLAGAFSPMAFAWLVLGFIQQGIELRQNSAALILQAEELRSAAKHAGAMVELQGKEFELRIQELEESRKKEKQEFDAEAERREKQAVQKLQPKFAIGLASRDREDPYIAKGELKNFGHDCTNVRIVMADIPGVLELAGSRNFLDFPANLRQPVVVHNHDFTPRTHPLEIHYTDAGGTERLQKFIVSVDDRYVHIDKVSA